MKPLTKAVRSSHVNGRNWKKELHLFLLNYRATPHTTTGFPPAKLLFNRRIKTKLPQVIVGAETEDDLVVRKKDQQAKQKMKENADVRRLAKPHTLQVGDMVLLKQRKQNKFSTKFDPSPFRVTRTKGTMITAARNENYVTRNASLLKKVNIEEAGVVPEECDEDPGPRASEFA